MSEQREYDFLEEPAQEEEQPAIEAEAAAEVQPETVETPEQPASEVPTTPEPREEHVPLAALKAEREKRQRYEAELAELRRMQQEQQFDPSVFYQDPGAIQQYVDHRLSSELAKTRIGISRSMVAAAHPDYEEMEELFVQAAMQNPALRDEMLRAENPALYAYQTAKSLQLIREAQSGELEKRIYAQAEAKIRAELSAKATPAVPPDLSNSRSAPASEGVPDDSLESILQSRKR